MNLRKNLVGLSILSTFLLFSNCKKENGPVEPQVNHKPTIDRIVASPEEPFINQVVNLECIASDEDDDVLSYDWRSDGGYFNSVDERRVVWNSPDQVREYHITVKADDGKEDGSTSKTKSLNVVSRFDTLYTVEDVFVYEKEPDKNYQNELGEYLFLIDGDYGRSTVLLKFESPKKDIISAKIRLTLRPAEDNQYELGESNTNIYKIETPWTQNTVTYNNGPTYGLTPLKRFIVPSFSLTSSITFYIENMKDIINSLKNNPLQDYGLALLPIVLDTYKSFYSKEGAQEYGNMNLAPALIIEYE